MPDDDKLFRLLFWRPPVGAFGLNPAWSTWARDWLDSLPSDDAGQLALYAARILRVQESRFPGALPPDGDLALPWPELRSIMGWGLDGLASDNLTRGALLQSAIRMAGESGWVLEIGRRHGEAVERYCLTVTGRNAAEYEMAPVQPFYLPEAGDVAPDPFVGMSASSRKAAGAKSGKPKGRPRKSDPLEDARLYEGWKRARSAGVTIKDFCEDNLIAPNKLQRTFDRHRKKIGRARSKKQE